MCLNKLRVGKHLSDIFPIQNGLKQNVLSPLLFNFALEYVIRKGHGTLEMVSQEGLRSRYKV